MNFRKQDWKLKDKIPIVYDGIKFDEGLRLDLLVEDLVIVETKAIEQSILFGRHKFLVI